MITGCKLSTDHLNDSRFMLGNIFIFFFQLFRFWPELFICDGLTDGEFESGRSKEWVRLKASPIILNYINSRNSVMYFSRYSYTDLILTD